MLHVKFILKIVQLTCTFNSRHLKEIKDCPNIFGVKLQPVFKKMGPLTFELSVLLQILLLLEQ